MPFSDIPAMLAAMRREDPSRPAVSFYRGRKLDGRMSYGELLSRVERMAGGLYARGVRRGDRVAMLSWNRLEVPALYLALWRLGAVAVPLNPGAPEDERQHALAHAEARVVDFEEGAPPPPEKNLGGEPAIILYTSGTTGNPKGVTLAQRSLLWNAWSMARNFGLRHTPQLAVLPLFHAHALGFGMMSALSTGGHLVLVEKLDPFTWAEVIRAESVRFTSVVPSLLPLLPRVTSETVPTLRALLVSSAPLSRERALEFEDRSGIPLIQGWGLSEFTNFACCLGLDDTERRRLLSGWETPSIGSPLDGAEVAILDGDGHSLPEETRGELCVRGPSRMIGYFKDPDATQKTLAGDWLRTGDEGLFRRVGGRRAFFITGRIKELIIRDGEKYSPLAIERKLLASLPELEGKLIVVGFPHQLHGEEIGAYLELPALDAPLQARLQAAVLKLAIGPKIILHGAAPIPRTHTGKIQRRKLQPAFTAFESCRGPLRIISASRATSAG